MRSRWLPALLAALCFSATAPDSHAQAKKPIDSPIVEKRTPTDAELKAMALKLNAITSADASQARLTELIKDRPTAKRLVTVAAEELKQAGDKPPYKYNAALILGKVAVVVKDLPASEGFFKLCFDNAETLQSGKKMMEAYTFLLAVYNQQKKFDKAETLVKRIMDSGVGEVQNNEFQFMEHLVLTLARGGNTDEAIAKIDGLANIVNKERVLWYLIKMRGDVYIIAEKYDEATKKYEEAIQELTNTSDMPEKAKTELKNSLRYALTGVYVDNKQSDKAIAVLEELVKENPETATYYNDLGFVMADNGKDLAKAEELVRKALKLEAELRAKLLKDDKITEEVAKQENAAYLDSLGWILYRQGKYEEAYKYLEQASRDADEGNHIEIWDHVADCLVKLGKKDEAIAVWTKALKLEDASKRDRERRKLVEAKLNAAKSNTGK